MIDFDLNEPPKMWDEYAAKPGFEPLPSLGQKAIWNPKEGQVLVVRGQKEIFSAVSGYRADDAMRKLRAEQLATMLLSRIPQ